MVFGLVKPELRAELGVETWVWVEENFVIEIGGEGGGDFLEVGFLAELRDMNEKDFGFERFFVSIFHGLEIDVITEIAAGVSGDNWVEPGSSKTLGEFREIDISMISDAVVAADGFEANGGKF